MNLINVSIIYSILPLKPGLTVLRYSALLNFALGFAMWHVKTKKTKTIFSYLLLKNWAFLKKSWDWSYNLTQDFISYTHSPPLFPFFTQRLRPNIIYSNVTWPCHMTQGSRDLDLGHVTLIYSMTTICLRCIHVQSSPSCSILIHSLLMSFSSLKKKKERKPVLVFCST